MPTARRRPEREQIATEIRVEMARQQKTQRDVAGWLGLPQGSVSKRLSGEFAFKAEEIAVLARMFKVPASRFIPDGEPERAA